MNRRRFLGLLAGAGAATATTYFLSPIGGWKSDVILSPHDVAKCHALCTEHLHKWQVDKVMADMKERSKVEYRKVEIEIEVGGRVGSFQPDGGTYFMGQASIPNTVQRRTSGSDWEFVDSRLQHHADKGNLRVRRALD